MGYEAPCFVTNILVIVGHLFEYLSQFSINGESSGILELRKMVQRGFGAYKNTGLYSGMDTTIVADCFVSLSVGP